MRPWAHEARICGAIREQVASLDAHQARNAAGGACGVGWREKGTRECASKRKAEGSGAVDQTAEKRSKRNWMAKKKKKRGDVACRMEPQFSLQLYHRISNDMANLAI